MRKAQDQWRCLIQLVSEYASATVADLKRMKELEAENAKLKTDVGGLALENTAIKDVLSRKL